LDCALGFFCRSAHAHEQNNPSGPHAGGFLLDRIFVLAEKQLPDRELVESKFARIVSYLFNGVIEGIAPPADLRISC
jgi:hypothetical protein